MSNIVSISEAANLALHAAIVLAASPERSLSIPDIVEKLKVSDHHLSKVMQRLTHAGLVDSVRGRHGGFRLHDEPSKMTLLEIFEAIEGPQRCRKCLLETPRCNGDCVFADFSATVNRMFIERLGSLRLSDVADRFK